MLGEKNMDTKVTKQNTKRFYSNNENLLHPVVYCKKIFREIPSAKKESDVLNI